MIPLLQPLRRRASDRAHSLLVRRAVKRHHGIVDFTTFQRDKWHLGSRYYTGRLANAGYRVFIKQAARGMVQNEATAWKQVFAVGGARMVPSMIAANETGRTPYVVFEWIDGGLLKDAFHRCNRDMSEMIARNLINLVDILHEANVVHRDIRPGNLMLRERTGELIAIDFALSVTGNPSPDSHIPYESLLVLGDGWNPEPLVWDDAYSALMIVRHLEHVCACRFDESAELERRIGRLDYRHDAIPTVEVANP